MTRVICLAAAMLAWSSPAAMAQLEEQASPQWPPPANQPDPAFDATGGMIKLDVVVGDRAGHAVTGLTAGDFTVLDNGQPVKLVSFAAYDGEIANPGPAPEVIIVIDGLNLDPLQVKAAESGIEKYLMKNDGHLAQPTWIYRLERYGLWASNHSSMNGPDLVKEIDSGKEPRSVLAVKGDGLPVNVGAGPCGSNPGIFLIRNKFSLNALGSIVLEQRRRAGRKVVVWMGPGWPVTPVCPAATFHFEFLFEYAVEFSTRMREAGVELSNVSAWPGADPGFDYKTFLAEATGGHLWSASLSLQVLAEHSGGLVLTTGPMQPSGDVLVNRGIEQAIEHCARDEAAFYRLTFDPAREAVVDEFHELKVEVAKPGLMARTRNGYYDQPSFYDQRRGERRTVTVSGLEAIVAGAVESRDSALGEELEQLELSERLSETKLRLLEARLPGDKSRQAMVALADASAFLPPRREDIPDKAAPTVAEQRQMLARTINYLSKTITKLPDFFATRTTTFYKEAREKSETWKSAEGDGRMLAESVANDVVHYRNGKEVVEAGTVRTRKPNEEQESLQTQGTFGPILSTVILDAAASKLEWSRWEQTTRGMRAVYRFSVPKEKSHYHASFCCLTDMNASGELKWITAYHGEMMIDAETGEILRLTVQADIDPKMPLERADIEVTYAPVQIGLNTYLCPQRSVAISRKRTVIQVHEWGGSLKTFGPYLTMLNDAVFSGFHKFGSESTILPGFIPVPESK